MRLSELMKPNGPVTCCQTYHIESLYPGLTGSELLSKYECLLNRNTGVFTVHLTEHHLLKHFTKSTLMNMFNFASTNECTKMHLLVNNSNPEVRKYEEMFKVIDAYKESGEELSKVVCEEQIDQFSGLLSLYAIDV